MNHAIITRLDFIDDNAFIYAFEMFKDHLLKCLEKQTDKNFDLYVRCQKKHELYFENISSLKINTFQFDGELPSEGGRKSVAPFKTDIFDTYQIQTRFDTDDIVHSTIVAKIHEIFKYKVKPTLISFQPKKLHLETGELYETKTYTPKKCSMFLSLFQPTPKHFIYQDSHLNMGKYVDEVVCTTADYCVLVIHGKNSMSKIRENDRKITR